MIRFKNHKHTGFTLAEIMIALFIMATLLSSIIILQQNSVQMIRFFSEKFDYMLQLRSLIVEQDINHARGIEKEQLEKKTDISSIMLLTKPVEKNSTLSSFKNIIMQQARARWKEGVHTRSSALISLLYSPEKKT